MHTQIASKIAALSVALMMNCSIMVGVVYLFNIQTHQQSSVIASVRAAAQSTHEAV
jgi:hypothetical protein